MNSPFCSLPKVLIKILPQYNISHTPVFVLEIRIQYSDCWTWHYSWLHYLYFSTLYLVSNVCPVTKVRIDTAYERSVSTPVISVVPLVNPPTASSSLRQIPTFELLSSWIKIHQLAVTCFIISLFTDQHVSNVSTSIFRSLRLIVNLFHVLYCSGSMCVGVTVSQAPEDGCTNIRNMLSSK